MNTIVHVYVEEYEADFFFRNKVLLTGWSCNDANWRHEYMSPLLVRLGFTVVSIFEPDEKLEHDYYSHALELATDWWGPIYSGDEQEEHY